MIDTPRVLAIIPARGGSKRLPRKNLLPLAGKPLINWSVEAALASGVIDTVAVTSDDEEILALTAAYGVVQMRRADHLASDTASTMDVVLDVIARLRTEHGNYDVVILLQPTSPLRRAEDIVAAYQVFRQGGGRNVVSVCAVDHPLQWCGTVTEQGLLAGFDVLSGRRSQDFPPSFRLNGAIYIASTPTLEAQQSFYRGDVLAYKMSRETSLDVDTQLDFTVCEALAQCRRID